MSIQNNAPAAGAENSAVVFVAIEMSRSRWDVVIHRPATGAPER